MFSTAALIGTLPPEKMAVIGPNGPELRRFTWQRSDAPFGTNQRVPEHDYRTERVEHTIDGKTHIVKIK